ncbi:hypothetical protein MXMO3_01714 [Maritalea myrionectae]|uniref:Lysozyme n=1 Tax=Maritalea myrionectae TaxID=454601 RepID=A0A2R4ME06_9HYPH|nr:hypothetical protein [Maritalea myrionectae]AVX04240.1 hypothetical protein MXMO3_01714 [Maritalea myrionectae]
MAKLPTKENLSRPGSFRTGTTISSADTSAIGRGIESLGASLGVVAEDIQRKQNAIDISRAEAIYTEQSLALQNEFERDGDYSTFDKRAPEKSSKIVETAADVIRDPQMRERWRLSQQPKVARLNDSIFDMGNALQEQAGLVAFNDALETNRRIYVDPDTNEQQKNQALADMEASIEVGLGSGLLTPAQAQRTRQEFINNSQFSRGLLAVKQNPDVVAAGNDSASILRSFEGFRPKPYWDVNAYRVGYGSDTVTRPDGTVEKVRPGMVITRADAERDLQRRIGEFQSVVIGQIGQDKWNSFSPNIQAALTSVSYNYGSLPDRIIDEVESGDPQSIASAVAGLAGDNEGVNRNRRMREARIIQGDINPAWYESLSPEQRQQIDATAQKTFADRQAADVAAIRAEQTRRSEALGLGILTGEVVAESQILNDEFLDDGKKATLLRSFRSENQDQLAAMGYIEGLHAGSAPRLNPLDSDQKKLGNNAYERLEGQLVSEEASREQIDALSASFFDNSGIVPDRTQNRLLNDVSSGNPQQVLQGAQLASRLFQIDPFALRQNAQGDKIAATATAYDFYTQDMGLPVEAAAQKIIALNDPEKQAKREQFLKSDDAKEFLKKNSKPGSILKNIGQGGVPVVGNLIGMGAAQLGFNPLQEAAITGEYKELLKEAYVEAQGDGDLAKKFAADRFNRLYGPTEMDASGDMSIVRLPPEKTYPVGADGTHQYIRQQAADALSEELGAVIEPGDVFLQPYDGTEKSLELGQAPLYKVLYRANSSDVVQEFNFPFSADPRAEIDAVQEEQADQIETSRERSDDVRTGIEEENRIKDAVAKAKEGGANPGEVREMALEEIRKINEDRQKRNEQQQTDDPLLNESNFMSQMGRDMGIMGGN